MAVREYPPGTRAPSPGTYEQLNVFGALTGLRITAVQDERLPAAPLGFTWRMMETDKLC
jgi:hypothetical protein